MSAAAIFASSYSGKAENYANEVAAPGYLVVKDATEKTKMGGLWMMWAMLIIWLLFSQVVAIRAVWNTVKGMMSALRFETSAPMKTKRAKGHARGQMIPKGVQAEIHDLDGMTVEGLKRLSARFGLKRSGLRDELFKRIKAELDEHEEPCSSVAQQ